MNALDSDILAIVYSFLDDRDCLNLSLTCKSLYSFFENCGALKMIRIVDYDNYLISITQIANHKRTLQEMILYDLEDPHLWIPHYPKVLHLYNCRYSYFDPEFESETEIIYTDKGEEDINPKKFKKARIIKI